MIYNLRTPRVGIDGAYIGELLRYSVKAETHGKAEVTLVLESDAKSVEMLAECVRVANEPPPEEVDNG